MNAHTVRTERVRGFQPPWYTVLVYRCTATSVETRLRVSWRGGAPNGAIIGTCGHLLRMDGAA